MQEHQEEVDLLLDRTKLEMQAASSQSGGASPRALTGPNIPSSPQLQASVEGVQQNALYSLPAAGKGKKRERADQNSDPSKTEHNVKFDDPDTSTLKRERSMKYDKIATILDKDGGLLNVGVVEHLVQLMRNDLLQDGGRKVADVVAHRTMLAGVIAATENSECLNQFVHLGGLCSLDDWLQEAHKGKLGGDGGSLKECDKVVEDLLLALLRALDRLPVDLKALKTCYVGKSVNHLRSHKNVDIQKKARKLVEVWKKRVDAEMSASSEAKPGSAGHGISWSYKQLPTELGHPLTKIGSGEVLEVAVKSSGAFAGNAKVAVNGANSAADGAVIKPLSVPPVSSKTASVQSPDLPTLKDSNSSKLPALSISPDMVTNPVKEEKSSSSSHTPSNGHSWGSAAAGKGGGNIAWKEDVKASVALSVNGGSSKTSSAGSPRLPNTKDLSGAAVSVGSKEVGGGGKPMVWSRSASTTEKAIVSAALPGTSSSAQRLIVRIPNPGKSPVGTSGGTADAAAPVSRSSSPSVLERHSSTGLADVLETKNTHQAESLAAFSPEEAGTNVKGGNGVKSGTGCSEDKSTVAPVNALECEKRTSTESVAHEKVGVKQESDSISKETLTSGCSSAAFRGAGEGSSPQVGDGGKDANGTSAADSVEDRPPRHSQVSPMEVDDGAMSLLASAAAEVGGMGSRTGTLERVSAEGETMKGEQQQQNGIMSVDVRLSRVNDGFSQYMAMEMGEALQSKDHSEAGVTHSALNHEIPSTKGSRGGGKVEPKEQHDGGSIERQGSVSPSDANREADSLSVEQRGGGGERTEKKLIVQEGAGQACEASSNTPSTLMSMAEPVVEKRRAIEASAKASVEHPFLKEFNASVMMNDLESKVSSSKFGKRDFILDERKSPRTQSKDISTTRDVCSGVGGVSGRDYRTHLGSFMESRTQDEKNGKRRGQEIGQLFGRRMGDKDGQRLAELVSGFPEEDVLEVARQAANEIEQMQENSKPVSSSSSERDGQNAQTAGSPTGGEMKDVTTTDTASKGQQQGSLTDAGDDKVKSSSNAQDQRDVMRALAAHVNGVEKFDRVEEAVAAKIVEAASPVDGEEVDQAMKEWKSPASRGGKETNTGLEGSSRGEISRVNSQQPMRSLSFQSIQADSVIGAPVPNSSTVSQPVGNSATTHNSHGDSTTPQQPVEGARHGGGDAAVSGSEASERPDFDLNEGFAGEDGPQDDDPITMPHSSSSALQIVQSATHPIASTASASGVAAPIAVLAATKGAFIPPTSPMWIKGELGWKGSAATSAFRPAEPRRTPDRQHSGAESLASDANLSLNANPVKRPRPLLEFDLNVADDRVMEDIGVAVTTLSSQGSVLEMSLQNQSLLSSSVSGVTFNKQESSPFLTFLKPESSSSAHPLSSGSGFGSLQASPGGQAPSSSGYGRTTRPNLDLDLNRMDDSEECRMMPFSSDARVAEGVGSLAPSNNSTSKPPARRVMDFDLNDGPSFEEVGVDEPTTLQSLPARKLAGNAPMPVPMPGLRMEGGEAMNFSPWFTPTGNPFAGVSSIPAFAPGRVPDPGYSVPPAAAAAAAANSFLNAGSTAATAMSPFNGEIFRGGPTLSASPAVVYPPPGERVAFGAHGPFPVFGGSPGYLPSSVPFSGSFMDVSGGPVPFPSQFGGQPTVNSSTYIRPPLLMGMTEAVVAADNSGGTWSRRSLDLNAGPEVIDTDIARDDVMHGRLPLLHPGNSAAFNDQMRVKLAQVSGNASLTTPLKRKEPEGGWNCYTGSGGYKQSTWR